MSDAKLFGLDDKKQFNLDSLVPDEVLESARAAGRASKKWNEEVAWRREHDPNFEEWYAAECKRINDEWAAMQSNETPDEAIARDRRCRGL